MKVVAAVALILLFLAPSAISQAPDDKLIVPGQRIGKWTLDMTVDDLLRMNGPATRHLRGAESRWAADAVRDYTLLTWSDRLPIGAATHDQRTVAFLCLWVYARGSFGYHTERGVGFGATRAQVLKTYGEPIAETPKALGQTRFVYDGMGIAFVFDGENMWDVCVFPRGTARRHWYLI